MVPAGTKITVSTSYQYSMWWYGDYSDGSHWNPSSKKSFSYTVNSDCVFECHAIIN